MTEARDRLARRLRAKPWTLEGAPFAHVVVDDVFRAHDYERLVRGYRAVFDRGLVESEVLEDRFCRPPSSRGPYAYVVRPTDRAFGVLFGRAWHDRLARLFGVKGDQRVSIALHYVPPRTPGGRPHNDLNPGWFPRRAPATGRVTVHDPRVSSYPTGRAYVDGVETSPSVRAVSVLLYLDNESWRPSWGGQTALYRVTDDEDAPSLLVPPRSNRLLAFACSPTSYHARVATGARPRRSIAMWIHRPRADAERAFGAGAIVPWT